MARRLTFVPSRISTIAPRVQRPPKIRADIYGTPEWKELVKRMIRERGRRCENPACRRMYDAQGIAIRIFVDHKIELADGGAPWDDGNLQLLCGSCHTTKTLKAKARRDAQRPARRRP